MLKLVFLRLETEANTKLHVHRCYSHHQRSKEVSGMKRAGGRAGRQAGRQAGTALVLQSTRYCQYSSSSEHFRVIYNYIIRGSLGVNHPVDGCATGDARPRYKDCPRYFTFKQATPPWGALSLISPLVLVTHRMEHSNNSRQPKHHAGTLQVLRCVATSPSSSDRFHHSQICLQI
jgi:hypothetical protein